MPCLGALAALVTAAPGDAARTVGRDVSSQLGSNLGEGFEMLAAIAVVIIVVVAVAVLLLLRALVRSWRARGE